MTLRRRIERIEARITAPIEQAQAHRLHEARHALLGVDDATLLEMFNLRQRMLVEGEAAVWPEYQVWVVQRLIALGFGDLIDAEE